MTNKRSTTQQTLADAVIDTSHIPHPTSHILSYRPFLEPLSVEDYWIWLALPLVLAICIVFKAIKSDHLRQLPRQALSLAVQVLVFMALAAAAIWLATELL